MPTDKLAIIIRVRPELKQALQGRAKAEGRTLTNLIEHAAVTYLNAAVVPQRVIGKGTASRTRTPRGGA